MIVIDTSIWIDHLRSAESKLNWLIAEGQMLQHPYVTGEIVAGNLQNRTRAVRALRGLLRIEPVSEDQFHVFIEHHDLPGTGLGFVDMHLLAATAGMPGAGLWTRDRRLRDQAERLGLFGEPPQ